VSRIERAGNLIIEYPDRPGVGTPTPPTPAPHTAWGTPVADIDRNEYCISCERDNREGHYDNCLLTVSDTGHIGHYSLFGTYWCDTCSSPYCELA